MSDLLREAIIDANMLREAALKNAETAIIEKYSNEVRQTLDQMLEQDEMTLDMGGEMGADAAGAPEGGLDMPAEDPMGDPMAAMPEEGAEGEGEVEDIDEKGEIPLAATDGFANLDGKNLKGFPAAGEEVELSIDLGALQEAIENMNTNSEIDLNEEELEALLDEDDDPSSQTWQVQPGEKEDPSAEEEEADSQAMQRAGLEEVGGVAPAATSRRSPHKRTPVPEEEEEEDDPLDEIVDSIMEKLTVDMGADLSGWAGRSSEDMKWAIEKALAHRRSTDVEEDLKVLKKAQDELVFENKQLNEQNTQYKQAFQELKENLQDVNLSNARLLYTNRVLRNASLNERQKTKIVEAISSAGSVTEAKTIYETLQSTVEATPPRRPQSLSEAINRRSSVIRATRQESSSQDPYADRMKKLAGIK